MVPEHLLRGEAALGTLLQQLAHLVGGGVRGGRGWDRGRGATLTPDPRQVRKLRLQAYQPLGPVGERLGEGFVADAHDAQLELLHRAAAEGGLAWLGLGLGLRLGLGSGLELGLGLGLGSGLG